MAFDTTPAQQIEVYRIAALMADSGLNPRFVTDAVRLALEYEGGYELMALWRDEASPVERDEIVADLQEEIDRLAEARPESFNAPKINFDELDRNIDRVQEFKRHLRVIVDRWGGISRLSRVTGIPQPSLSRFFNSGSFPRQTTIYRIVRALVADSEERAADWYPPVNLQELDALVR